MQSSTQPRPSTSATDSRSFTTARWPAFFSCTMLKTLPKIFGAGGAALSFTLRQTAAVLRRFTPDRLVRTHSKTILVLAHSSAFTSKVPSCNSTPMYLGKHALEHACAQETKLSG